MVIAIDTETWLIEPGLLAPPLVCVTWAKRIKGEGRQLGIRKHDHPEALSFVADLLHSDRTIIGANIPYDMAVLAAEWPELLPAIFAAYEDDRITDVQTRQKLIDIANGQLDGWRNAATGKWVEHKYSLGALVMRHLSEDRSSVKSGPDVWRLRYKELHDVPIDDWPEEALSYAIGDATDTLRVYEAQEPDAQFLEDEFRQARAHFCLHLMSCRGIMTDPKAVASYEKRIRAELEESKAEIIDMGWLVPKLKREPHGELKRSVKAVHAYCEKHHPNISRTPTKKPQLDKESVRDTGDPKLISYQHYSSSKTIMTKVEGLWGGTKTPIQARFNVIVESGRSSCRGDNIQNRSRKPGDRECFVPRKGWVFANSDYDGMELRSSAQIAIWVTGASKLADALNSGMDPHVMLAATQHGFSYEDALALYKEEKAAKADAQDTETMLFARQHAKKGNFGFLGGLGANGFVLNTIKEGATVCGKATHNKRKDPDKGLCVDCLQAAAALREHWLTTWPEMREYFKWITALVKQNGTATIRQFGSNRYRGQVTYTSGANTFFQGLAADAAKAALFRISEACYIGNGPLRGSFPINFIHDEFIVEVRDDEHAHDAAHQLSDIMVSAANEWIPDVPTTAEPLLMRRWSKDALAVHDDNGRLIPWDCDV